ncbi:MAG: hypothetical protein ACPHP7_10045 [Planctomycetota bacterium]
MSCNPVVRIDFTGDSRTEQSFSVWGIKVAATSLQECMLTDQCRISTAKGLRSSSIEFSGRGPGIGLILGVLLILCAGCSGSSPTRGAENPRGSLIPLQPRTTKVMSLRGETLADVAHRTGFEISVLEGLNPSLVDVRLSTGVEIRCPVGQPGIRRVEQRPSKGARD